MEFRAFYKTWRTLKKHLPLSHPVRLRRVPLSKLDGDCDYRNDTYWIRIDKALPEYYAIEVLIHELAHALAWGKDKDSHGPNWGKAYSFVYRTYLSLDLVSLPLERIHY